jgi:hypothetical protein
MLLAAPPQPPRSRGNKAASRVYPDPGRFSEVERALTSLVLLVSFLLLTKLCIGVVAGSKRRDTK